MLCAMFSVQANINLKLSVLYFTDDDPSEEDEKINHLECVKVDDDKHEDDVFENYALEYYDYLIMPMMIYIKFEV